MRSRVDTWLDRVSTNYPPSDCGYCLERWRRGAALGRNKCCNTSSRGLNHDAGDSQCEKHRASSTLSVLKTRHRGAFSACFTSRTYREVLPVPGNPRECLGKRVDSIPAAQKGISPGVARLLHCRYFIAWLSSVRTVRSVGVLSFFF